jgi:hypothetical protein
MNKNRYYCERAISKCINNRGKTVYGYAWEFVK